ncbi:Lipolytic protein G-D-S-L family [Magnetospirillum sp. LM-5]|uniref:GDSL-type esterase/lipase family protein n=1 Tax=Magnetospirillum sp. LM-5 TaxID=2681466 RepID=UPI0013802E8B|nr:GDSL-type esterase/lipase family protein [Magnetospirillum sp. LM-5]CAA7617856.1 Lipolytic protein G-D-S-L family [Magnetospirillum sp. LM-5]
MRLCFVGDSFVNGTNDPDGLGWVGRACRDLRAEVNDFTLYNLGIRRDTSADIRARWRGECGPRLPAGIDGRVVFSFGVNDCSWGDVGPRVAPDQAMANAQAILVECRAQWPTLMVGPPPIACADTNSRIALLSAALADLCGGIGVPYLAVFDDLAASPEWMAEVAADDGAHPRAGGYAVLADLVRGWEPFAAWLSR